LASGGSNGEIKVWHVKEQAYIHSFNPGHSWISALLFAGGADTACIAASHTGSIIRLWRAEGSLDFASETIVNEDLSRASPKQAFSPSGSFLATGSASMTGSESTLALYDLETLIKTQSVVMPGFIATSLALSPDSKQFVVGDSIGRLRLLQTDDFSIQRDVDTKGEVISISSVAFDPACRVLAFGYRDGRLELRTL
jgi:WD40 repeat protein